MSAGQAVCARCRSPVAAADLEQGKAIYFRERTYCATCRQAIEKIRPGFFSAPESPPKPPTRPKVPSVGEDLLPDAPAVPPPSYGETLVEHNRTPKPFGTHTTRISQSTSGRTTSSFRPVEPDLRSPPKANPSSDGSGIRRQAVRENVGSPTTFHRGGSPHGDRAHRAYLRKSGLPIPLVVLGCLVMIAAAVGFLLYRSDRAAKRQSEGRVAAAKNVLREVQAFRRERPHDVAGLLAKISEAEKEPDGTQDQAELKKLRNEAEAQAKLRKQDEALRARLSEVKRMAEAEKQLDQAVHLTRELVAEADARGTAGEVRHELAVLLETLLERTIQQDLVALGERQKLNPEPYRDVVKQYEEIRARAQQLGTRGQKFAVAVDTLLETVRNKHQRAARETYRKLIDQTTPLLGRGRVEEVRSRYRTFVDEYAGTDAATEVLALMERLPSSSAPGLLKGPTK